MTIRQWKNTQSTACPVLKPLAIMSKTGQNSNQDSQKLHEVRIAVLSNI